MKTQEAAQAQRRPYDPPVLQRQSDLKKITLYTDVFSYGDPAPGSGHGGGPRVRDSR